MGFPSGERRAGLTALACGMVLVLSLAAGADAAIVSQQLSGAFTAASPAVQPLINAGLLPARFAYVTGGPSQTGPAGTQFSAVSGFPQYLSIDLGFQTFAFTPGSGGIAGSILLEKGATTDTMRFDASDNLNNATLAFVFKDTRRFLASQSSLPATFPSPSAFSPDAGNNGWGGTAPSFGFELIFTFNGQVSFVRGDLFPSTLADAPVPPSIPEPAAAGLLAAASALGLRRRR
jgi:hypothetical protein